jgi:hypothetical protein
MATFSYTNLFTAGTPAVASQVNTNFNDVKTFVQGISTGTNIDGSAISEAKIAAGAVTEVKLATGAVTETKIGAAAVTEAKLATGAITADKIASNAITEVKIATNAITADKIASGAVGASEIADGSVGTVELADGAVTASKKSGFFGILYEDYGISGVAASNSEYPEFTASDHIITLGAGRSYTDIVSVVPLQGVNSWLRLHSISAGGWANVLGTNQIIVNCSLGNTVAGNTGAIRVYYRA